MSAITITANTRANRLDLFTIFRIALGFIIFWKAINFIRDTTTVKLLIERTGIEMFSHNSEVLGFVIAFLGLLGGFFIVVGLFTKVSCIIQIPILIVAVFFVNIKNINNNVFEFILSVVALLLLIFFAIKGSGKLSADEYFRRGAAADKNSQKAFR